MDRIEPAEDHNASNENFQGPQHAGQPTETGPVRPAGPTPLRTRGNSRTRRPSIRLTRCPSIPSLENVNQPVARQENPSLPSFESRPIRSPPPNEEDEAWLAGRRRSSSDPNPGRWSSPDGNSRVATPMRMMPLTEENSHQSHTPTSPVPILPAQKANEELASEQLEIPPAAARPAGRLRRTSQAALNRFTRNRASTVTGAAPTLSSPEEQRQNEYGSHVVDVLDVIGKNQCEV